MQACTHSSIHAFIHALLSSFLPSSVRSFHSFQSFHSIPFHVHVHVHSIHSFISFHVNSVQFNSVQVKSVHVFHRTISFMSCRFLSCIFMSVPLISIIHSFPDFFCQTTAKPEQNQMNRQCRKHIITKDRQKEHTMQKTTLPIPQKREKQQNNPWRTELKPLLGHHFQKASEVQPYLTHIHTHTIPVLFDVDCFLGPHAWIWMTWLICMKT